MTIINTATELKPAGQKACLAIGFFDGVHLGHQQIIRQTVTDARQHEAAALVITFDRHPNSVVAPHRVPPLIYSLPQKLRAIESLGADALLLLHFDQAFSQQTGETFIRTLARELAPSTLNSPTLNLPIQSLCVGSNFVFGHKRDGNVELLKKLGAELKFAVHGLAAVALDGKAVSSTRIRESVSRGNLDTASQMLGRAYSLAGNVVRGDGLGRQLGFPTANLDIAGLVLPPHGVYAVHAEIRPSSLSATHEPPLAAGRPAILPLSGGEGRGEGELSTPHTQAGKTCRTSRGFLASTSRHRAVLNIGLRPTLQNPAPQLRVEAHLLDFQGDIYGQELEIIFGEKLRDEKKFPSLDALRDQIARDILDAQSRF